MTAKHDFRRGPLLRGPKGDFTRHSGPVEWIVLHYSWTLPHSGWNAQRIHDDHVKRGWNGIGYHYLIHENGTREYGRPEWAQGAHVRGANDRKIGICVIGGRIPGDDEFGHDNRTDEQKNAQFHLVKELLQRHPGTKVAGHRDFVATQCPGYDAAKWWNLATKAKPAPATANKPLPRQPERPAPWWVILFNLIAGWFK